MMGGISQGMSASIYSSLVVNFVTEFGDNTFFIVALLSMTNPTWQIIVGAIISNVLMTAVSTLIGASISFVVPLRILRLLSVGLLFYFSWKLFLKSQKMKSGSEFKDLRKAEEAVNHRTVTVSALSVILQTFALCFFGEWGDRSQLSTVTLAATESAWGVVVGASLGQVACTVLGALLGKSASRFVSPYQITLASAITFAAFALWELGEWTGIL